MSALLAAPADEPEDVRHCRATPVNVQSGFAPDEQAAINAALLRAHQEGPLVALVHLARENARLKRRLPQRGTR